MNASSAPDRDAEGVYRVYRLPEDLRAAMKARRSALGQTVAEFVAEAVAQELPALVEALLDQGLAAAGPGCRPARLRLPEPLLADLRAAALRTGLPAALLLRCSLARAARRKRRRSSGGRGLRRPVPPSVPPKASEA